jgi:hypothetical protein
MGAVGANGVSVPALGDAHPDPDFAGAIVVNKATETDPSFDIVNVFVFYRWRSYLGSYLKSTSGAINQVSRLYRRLGGGTVGDVNATYGGSGSTLTLGVQLTYAPPGASTVLTYPAFVDENVMETMFSFKFLEQMDPEYFNATYPGYCNSQVWRGYPPRTVMILPINGTSQDNYWYENVYSFKYKSDTYDRYLFFVDPDTGIVPSTISKTVRYTPGQMPDYAGLVDSGNGWARVIPEKLLDFNLLFKNLPVTPPDRYGLDFDQFKGS